jgi:hypothetical protein
VLCNIGAYIILVSLTNNMENSMTFLQTCIILNILIFFCPGTYDALCDVFVIV